jgi:hypothetical protein
LHLSVLGNERPAPPDELTEEEAEEWRAIASRMPHDWWTRENFPLLCEYCRHIVRARDLAKDITAFKRFPPEVRLTSDGIQRYDMLLRMADRERAAIVQLAADAAEPVHGEAGCDGGGSRQDGAQAVGNG